MSKILGTYSGKKRNEVSAVSEDIRKAIFDTHSNCYVVVIDETDSKGCINKTEVHIFYDYRKMNDFINQHEYITNQGIDVYWSDGVGTVSIMHKVFDGMNYRRYAQCGYEKIEVFFQHKLWSAGATVIEEDE